MSGGFFKARCQTGASARPSRKPIQYLPDSDEEAEARATTAAWTTVEQTAASSVAANKAGTSACAGQTRGQADVRVLSARGIVVDELAEVEIHAEVAAKLMPHQVEGIKFLFQRYLKNDGGALLADEMGLGKTAQAAVFMALVHEYRMKRGKSRHPSLLVVPRSLVTNWLDEMTVWAPSLRVVEFAKSRKDELVRSLYRKRGADVLMCTYEAVRDHTEWFAEEVKLWSLMIMDEIHVLKNPDSGLSKALATISCSRRFGLTGTPVQNSIMDLYQILWQCVSHSEQFPTEAEFTSWYAEPLTRGQYANATGDEMEEKRRAEEQLEKLKSCYMLRRLSRNVLRNVLGDKSDLILECKAPKQQLDLLRRLEASLDYEFIADSFAHRNGSEHEYTEWKAEMVRRMHENPASSSVWHGQHESGAMCPKCPMCLAFPLIHWMMKICSSYKLILPDIRDRETDPKRYAKMKAMTRYLLGEHYKNYDRDRLTEHDLAMSAKLTLLSRLLESYKKNNEKVLIFSNFTKVLDVLKYLCIDRGYVFSRLDGNTTNRQEVVNDFNSKVSSFVFLISTRAGGIGLNITSACRVILYDPGWNPSFDLQAQDRAFRIGQEKDVIVSRLIVANTIEQEINKRQILKLQLSRSAYNEQDIDEARFFLEGDVRGIQSLFSYQAHTQSGVEKPYQKRMREVNEQASQVLAEEGDVCVQVLTRTADDKGALLKQRAPDRQPPSRAQRNRSEKASKRQRRGMISDSESGSEQAKPSNLLNHHLTELRAHASTVLEQAWIALVEEEKVHLRELLPSVKGSKRLQNRLTYLARTIAKEFG
ncbi:Switch 2 [Porphyridium purpureum]|uniref:Switch 2 n=1 Tax=Porphyridium purpureum TaxID=35688 RepID=A0A5J4YUD0_PORPP|nr:Switch 2 [Porphyridium purpureum]|eukprot:POR6930..scf227_4